MSGDAPEKKGWIAGVVHKFLTSRLSVVAVVLSFCLGIAAVMVTPREEEPQIVVPLADVFVQVPGATPAEVEKQVADPLERLLWQIDGVEYVYSTSRNDMAVVTVRFYVGEDRENSLVKLYNKISMNIDRAPAVVRGWVVKPVEIDDVPIVNLTLYSPQYDDHQLRRIGQEVLARLSRVADISRTDIHGGRGREVRVALLPQRMDGFGISLLEVYRVLQGADASVTAGEFDRFNTSFRITGNAFLTSADQVAALMVGVTAGRPVYLRDIAQITDGPQEVSTYTRIGHSFGYRARNHMKDQPLSMPAVTLAIAKKKGTNAVNVANNVLAEVETLKKTVIPDDVMVEVTRNYGKTANEKVNGLLSSLLFAIVTVVILLAFTLGWREAAIVAMSVPISFSLALFVNYLFGYTINRVTLFALILSLGLVVDDPITVVDNIQRNLFLGIKTRHEAIMAAVQEVAAPVVMSTLAIIVSFTPLFFITGMMGPYMAPMAANVPITVTFSTFCAISIVPWFCNLLIKKKGKKDPKATGTDGASPGVEKAYRLIVEGFLTSRIRRWMLAGVILGLLAVAAGLAVFRLVPLKMLPFDNKNEFQLVVDMPEGTPLEATDSVVSDFEDYLQKVPEVTSFVSYVGTSSPIDFNGMVRHYYLRKGGYLADIRVNLVEKDRRAAQSHAIVLRLRSDLEKIAKKNNATLKIVEVPPGPPVISTIVAEIYGGPEKSYADLIQGAEYVKKVFDTEPFVADVDDTAEAPRDRYDFVIDKEKAALHGVSTKDIVETLRIAMSGATPASIHLPHERQPLMVRMILPRVMRSRLFAACDLPVKGAHGNMVPLIELGKIRKVPEHQPIYHKNLAPVVYVTGEMAGRAPAEAILDMQSRLKKDPPPSGIDVQWAGEGEWKITLRVFRDMGIAFAAAMVGIYILLIMETNSFFMPLLIMMAIPLTLIGAMPGFYLLNLISGETVGGFFNPVFFTATSMIGMIALGGIVIRNAVVLIDFIQQYVTEGHKLKDAILKSGAIRMRPILLTALTTALGAWPITLDPIFSGLAWCLIFGLFASTAFTLVVVPVAYYALYNKL